MQLSHLPAAVALLATLSLWFVLLTRAPGINEQMTALLQACFAYGIAWVFTGIASVILVKNGAFDWVPARYAVMIGLHVIGGAVGLMGVMGLVAFESEWWILPCVAFATVLPLLVQGAALHASFRSVLFIVVALQAVAIVAGPAGYFVRVAMKERANVAYNVNWNDALSERASNLSSNATIDQYFRFVVEPRHLGIAELAARKLAKREDHEAMLVEALGGPNRFEALCLLAVEGVPPTAVLALAVKKAIAAGASTEQEHQIAAEVAKRFAAFGVTAR